MIFEAKALRDYFVDKTVIPKSIKAAKDFMDLNHFTSKFLPMLQERYVNVDNSKRRDALQSPAIINFFKHKFIIKFEIIDDKDLFGDELKLHLANDGSWAAQHNKTIANDRIMRFLSEVEELQQVEKCAAEIHS